MIDFAVLISCGLILGDECMGGCFDRLEKGVVIGVFICFYFIHFIVIFGKFGPP